MAKSSENRLKIMVAGAERRMGIRRLWSPTVMTWVSREPKCSNAISGVRHDSFFFVKG